MQVLLSQVCCLKTSTQHSTGEATANCYHVFALASAASHSFCAASCMFVLEECLKLRTFFPTQRICAPSIFCSARSGHSGRLCERAGGLAGYSSRASNHRPAAIFSASQSKRFCWHFDLPDQSRPADKSRLRRRRRRRRPLGARVVIKADRLYTGTSC